MFSGNIGISPSDTDASPNGTPADEPSSLLSTDTGQQELGVSLRSRSIEPRLRFSGHQTFPFRYGWLPKAVEAVHEDAHLFGRPDALVRLGVGKNMVASIRHWCGATGLMTFTRATGGKKAETTRLARLLFGAPNNKQPTPPPPRENSHRLNGASRAEASTQGADPYLEDPGTLWLLHWRLTAPPAPASTWHLAFTRFAGNWFTRDELTGWLYRFVGAGSNGTRQPTARRSVSMASLKRDVDCFLRTYLPPRSDRRRPPEDSFDCPLAELGLLRSAGRGRYGFPRGQRPSLPDELLAFAILEFWRDTAAAQETLALERLLYDPGSPGAAFRLDDRSLIAALERLSASRDLHSGLDYDETAGLRQVRRRNAPEPAALLEGWYTDR